MEIKVFTLPTFKDENYREVETKYIELHSLYRRNETALDENELDWMDTANNWLHSHG